MKYHPLGIRSFIKRGGYKNASAGVIVLILSYLRCRSTGSVESRSIAGGCYATLTRLEKSSRFFQVNFHHPHFPSDSRSRAWFYSTGLGDHRLHKRRRQSRFQIDHAVVGVELGGCVG